jgi:hypothetical protein
MILVFLCFENLPAASGILFQKLLLFWFQLRASKEGYF